MLSLKSGAGRPLEKAIDAFVTAVERGDDDVWRLNPREIPESAPFLAPEADAAAALLALLGRLSKKKRNKWGGYEYSPSNIALDGLVTAIFQRRPALTSDHFEILLKHYAPSGALSWTLRLERLARVLIGRIEADGLTDQWRVHLKELILIHEGEVNRYPNVTDRRNLQALRNILAGVPKDVPTFNENWQKPLSGAEISQLVKLAQKSVGTSPSKKWHGEAETLLKKSDLAAFELAYEQALAEIRKLEKPVDAEHSDMLRGLCWLLGLAKTPRSASLLGQMLSACGHKLPGFGARSQKGFSGCVDALARLGTTEGLAELSKARAKIKTPSLSDNLTRTLTTAAEKQGLPLAELEELVVPVFGLELPGRRIEAMGEVSAELRIVGSTQVQIEWFKNGRVLKSRPTLADEWKADAAELAKVAKDAKDALGAQRARIEALYFIERSWPYPLWRERYVDHPLLAPISRRLIWRFETGDISKLGMAPDGVVVEAANRAVIELGENTVVRLWHPIESPPGEVEEWREFLFTHEIRQPFKQAHREVYLLTDAEMQTSTYSNRFAAHVLKQHQMAALMRNRGWRYALMGWFDFHNTPTLALPESELKAQFWIDVPEFVHVDDQHQTESGTALYVATDQVCFITPAEERVSLETIPARTLSEVMRDVDLFVGVCSVGNDPAWQDQGERLGYGTYWRQVSFGDLSASAETRKSVLVRLLPRLEIANVAQIDGKFLVVRGNRRTYKIHLGSGNILMEPNDQYLCIVPGRGKDDAEAKVFLPFEGDSILAVILSKAMMLAADDKIKDTTILSQLKR